MFWGFFKVSSFTFGGGFGAIALIRDLVLGKGWLDEEMLTYMIAVGESTPGPIMVNLATYIGSAKAGFLGAVVATSAVVLPAFLIIILITALLKNFIKNPYVQAVLRGLKPCVTGIILATGCYMVFHNCAVMGMEVPVSVKAVMTASPAANACTLPLLSTLAMAELLLFQLTRAVALCSGLVTFS